jgi:hypothetical protein
MFVVVASRVGWVAAMGRSYGNDFSLRWFTVAAMGRSYSNGFRWRCAGKAPAPTDDF